MSNEQHVIEDLPAYALGCLDDDSRVRVSQHLAACPACRAELETYQDVADQLACVAPEVQPSEGLKERLMERVRPSRREPAKAPWWQRLPRLVRLTAPVWGGVAVILVVVLSVSNLWLLGQTTRSGPMRTIAIQGTEARPNATGTLIISQDGEHGALVVDGLDPLDAEHQYQAWLIENGQRTSGGVFSVDDDGYAVLWLSSPKSLTDYGAVGVTIEPAGGSPGPTGTKVLGGNLNL